jgi:hypothetical protein
MLYVLILFVNPPKNGGPFACPWRDPSISLLIFFLAFDIIILSISLELYWKNELCENVLPLGNLVMAFRVRFISALDLFCKFFFCVSTSSIGGVLVGWLVEFQCL